MSKDPKPASTPAKTETLEDAVYKSSLSAGNEAVARANPAITLPLTILAYVGFGFFAIWLGKSTELGQKAIKSIADVMLDPQDVVAAPPPPPPPPPPPAAVIRAPDPKDDVKIDPRQEVVPETPKELPKVDRSASGSQAGGVPGGVPGGVVGGVAGGVVGGVVGGTGRVMDVDFSQVKVKFQPPTLQYPPLAKMAKIQGTVIVEITINPEGHPTEAVAKEGPVQLRKAAEDFARLWRFEPQKENGIAQYSRFKLNVVFRLK